MEFPFNPPSNLDAFRKIPSHGDQNEHIDRLERQKEKPVLIRPLPRQVDWRAQLRAMVSTYSFNEAEMAWRNGLIDERAWIAFVPVWSWCSFRCGGCAGHKQEVFWKRFGKEAYMRKINRTRTAFGFEPI